MPNEKPITNHAIWVRPEDKAKFDELCQRHGYSAPQWTVFRDMLRIFLMSTQREHNAAEVGSCITDAIQAANDHDYDALKLAIHQAHSEIDALFTNIGWSEADEARQNSK